MRPDQNASIAANDLSETDDPKGKVTSAERADLEGLAGEDRAPHQRGDDAGREDRPDFDRPVFDRAIEDLPVTPEDSLPMDAEGNILPGADNLDEDPDDNGAEEQNDPDAKRRRMLLGNPMPD